MIIDGDKAFDAATGAPIRMPANPESVTVNNRIRGELAGALAALELFDADAPFAWLGPEIAEQRQRPTWRRCWRGRWKRKAMPKSRPC